jgi:hypothetical protein
MMKRFPISGTITDIELAPNVHALECFFRKDDVVPLYVHLALLNCQMIEGIIFESDKNQKVRLAVSLDLPMSKITLEDDGILILFCVNDLEAVESFLLHYCRDGFTAVDHIDIELSSNDRSTEYSLVIRTDVFRAPMSSHEARKLLGLE